MLKILTHKLKAQSLNEVSPFQAVSKLCACIVKTPAPFYAQYPTFPLPQVTLDRQEIVACYAVFLANNIYNYTQLYTIIRKGQLNIVCIYSNNLVTFY